MPEVVVRDSPIGGLGVFTVERLRAGQTIREFELGREITPDAPLRPDRGERPEHCPLIDGRFYLVGSPDRHFNHSCGPSVCMRFAASRIEVVARRDIEADDELTLDYLINNGAAERTAQHGVPAREAAGHPWVDGTRGANSRSSTGSSTGSRTPPAGRFCWPCTSTVTG